MESFDFRITTEAVEFLRKYLLRADSGEELVLTVAPLSTHRDTLGHDDSDPESSYRKLAERAKDYLESLSSPIAFQWVVGGMRKSRLPKEQVLLIDGIQCFFPDEVKVKIGGRVLRLRDGNLVFDPELDPPPNQLLPPSGT